MPQYLGHGTTVALPPGIVWGLGESTAEAGPIHVSVAWRFELDGEAMVIARRLEGDRAVIAVDGGNAELQACIVDSAIYDRQQDERD